MSKLCISCGERIFWLEGRGPWLHAESLSRRCDADGTSLAAPRSTEVVTDVSSL